MAAEQTAYGVVVDAATAAPLVGPGEALFMDWRPDHGEPGWPTFLYAVPLGGDAVLLEETSLARRPGLPLARAAPPPARPARPPRHHRRHADARVERVRFPVDRPRHATPGVLGFGAAAPLVHPATGFSVADALRLAPVVADALAHAAALRAAHASCGPPAPSPSTACGGSAWKPCCACPPRPCPASSRPSSPSPPDTVAPTSPAATTSPGTSPPWALCSAAPTSACAAASSTRPSVDRRPPLAPEQA